jgi:hypothetical protein
MTQGYVRVSLFGLPVREPWLPASLTDIQEGIIQTAGPCYLQRDLHPEALLTVRLKQKSNQPPSKYIFSDLQAVFAQKMRVTEQTR